MANYPTKLPVASILIVLPWSPALPGGVSVVVRNLLDQWKQSCITAKVIVSEWSATQLNVDAEGNANFRFALVGVLNWLGLTKSLISAPVRLWRTWKLLQQHDIGAVNFHYPSLDAIGIAVLKRLGLYRGKIVLSFHGTDVRGPATAFEQRLWRWLLGVADGVTACSKALADELVQAYGLSLQRVTVVYNGVDTNIFAPLPRFDTAAVQAPVDPYIVSVGSYIPRKGHRTLLDAFAAVADTFPHLSLVIVGMDGPERMRLLDRAKEHRVLDRIALLVNLVPAEVAKVVASATLAVQPSLAEPFGMAVIEAGACAVPVLASAVGGHVELITDQQNGCLFAAGDVAQCAQKLRQMLADPKTSQQMAARFRSEIQVKYTWQVCASNYLQKMV